MLLLYASNLRSSASRLFTSAPKRVFSSSARRPASPNSSSWALAISTAPSVNKRTGATHHLVRQPSGETHRRATPEQDAAIDIRDVSPVGERVQDFPDADAIQVEFRDGRGHEKEGSVGSVVPGFTSECDTIAGQGKTIIARDCANGRLGGDHLPLTGTVQSGEKGNHR